jgi:hypothetical protein
MAVRVKITFTGRDAVCFGRKCRRFEATFFIHLQVTKPQCEDGSSSFFRNVDTRLLNYKALYL